ncbi:YbjQ family protein [Marivita geojedonensis]|uniref:UPF0145 protein MGEO_14335 n=1 Tax=Marivita geojedonensis TaxID=1123756 RepID=A0A1X4NIL0_9RHOB|nr:heavy metal-binding domain-containing protein [Marivita geojedonensis]OSQ48555.1 hypothetical protein MGEO_14335 [Marivita geojedonensis]PRY75094.1 uncharacterized protein YbjQ (UPF0145 family) [Marivita geojedonensis]
MASCSVCGKELGLFGGNRGMCQECFLESVGTSSPDQVKQRKLEHAQLNAAIEAIMLTTEAYPQGISITKRIEVVTAECAFGMHIFKDLFASVRDIVGGRSEAVQNTLRDARRTTLYELKKEAYEVGANAVVGVDLDYVELSAVGTMVILVASGTAVTIEEA